MRRPRIYPAGSPHQRAPYTAADFQSAMYGSLPRVTELQYLLDRLGSADELLPQSQPLTGTVYTDQGPMLVTEAVAVFNVGEVLFRFGTWVVTADGIACVVHQYPLTRARLQEHQDWAGHLAEQPWVNLWDLLRALVVEHHIRAQTTANGPAGAPTHPA